MNMFVLHADSANGLQEDKRFLDIPRWSKKNSDLFRGV